VSAPAAVGNTRTDVLAAALQARRDEVAARLKSGLATVRDAEGPAVRGGALDDLDASADDLQREIAFATMQAQGEILQRIDEALRRLAQGQYGRCRECGDEIAEARLAALPFAVRCVDCERRREGGPRSRPGAAGRGEPGPHARA
jgi:DnaK suppressor protein